MIQQSTSEYIFKENKIRFSKSCLHSHTHCNITHNSQETRETTVYIWLDKEDVVNIDNVLLFKHEKDVNLAICDKMDGLWGHYAMVIAAMKLKDAYSLGEKLWPT